MTSSNSPLSITDRVSSVELRLSDPSSRLCRYPGGESWQTFIAACSPFILLSLMFYWSSCSIVNYGTVSVPIYYGYVYLCVSTYVCEVCVCIAWCLYSVCDVCDVCIACVCVCMACGVCVACIYNVRIELLLHCSDLCSRFSKPPTLNSRCFVRLRNDFVAPAGALISGE